MLKRGAWFKLGDGWERGGMERELGCVAASRRGGNFSGGEGVNATPPRRGDNDNDVTTTL